MLYAIRVLNFGLMIALPIVLGLFLSRKLGMKWGLFGVGALTFIASQVVHLPLNSVLSLPSKSWSLPANAVALGLTAGLCEEIARYLVYRYWLKTAQTWREALMFGAGHGGIEAIILGGLAGVAFINLVALRNVDVATLPVPVNQQVLAAKQIAAYWSAPWYAILLGAVERAFSLCFHLSAAVMVLQVFQRKNILWLGAAILWHATADASAVFASGTWGPYWTEAIVGAFAIASLAIIFVLRPFGAETPLEVGSALPPAVLPRAHVPDPEADLKRKMDETRFTS